MENLTLHQILRKYPHLQKQTDKILIIDEQENEHYRNDQQTVMDVSVELLIRLLTDEKYFHYVEKLNSSYIEIFSSRFIKDGELVGGVDLTKVDIVRCLSKIIDNGYYSFDEIAMNRFLNIKKSTSYEEFLRRYSDKNFDLTIEGESFSIPIGKIINFITSENEEYDNLLDSETLIAGIKKEYFLYACCKFFEDNNIFDNFILPSTIMERYDELSSFEKVDFQAVNSLPNNINKISENIVIDRELKDEILRGIPEDGSNIEKAIYIYIKMCKLLTYDDEYYVKGQIGDHTNKHSDINNISNVTLQNNKVVCTEFNAILGKFLEELGILYVNKPEGMEYGNAHSWLKFKSDKFLVEADAALSILYGDLARAKFNKPLEGLKCLNENAETQKEFLDIIRKMYARIIEEEKKKEEFEKVVARYQQVTTNLQAMSLDEKLKVLIDKVRQDNVSGIDLLFNILQMKKIIFNEQELNNNVSIVFVRDNSEETPSISTVFVLNAINVKLNTLNNRYFVFNNNGDFQQTSRSSLQEKFDNKRLEYTIYSDLKVPGISSPKGEDYARKVK